MKLLWLVVVATLGCSGKKDKDPPKPRPVVADAGIPCAERTAALTDWIRKLVGEGHRTVVATGVNLVKLPEPPGRIPRGIVVVVKPNEVVIEGTAVADPATTKGAEMARTFIERVTAVKGDPGVVFVVDEKTPWSAVVALANAAPQAERARVSFVFAAAAGSEVEPPPPSSLDAHFAAAAEPADPGSAAAKLADPVKTVDEAKLYAECPAVTELWPKLDALTPDIFDVAIADELPKAIELCDCKVEIPAVQRVLWAMWGRDTGAALVAVNAEMAKDAKGATKVTQKPATPWGEAYTVVIDAAQAGKPLVFE